MVRSSPICVRGRGRHTASFPQIPRHGRLWTATLRLPAILALISTRNSLTKSLVGPTYWLYVSYGSAILGFDVHHRIRSISKNPRSHVAARQVVLAEQAWQCYPSICAQILTLPPLMGFFRIGRRPVRSIRTLSVDVSHVTQSSGR